jgi:hypothetical protein
MSRSLLLLAALTFGCQETPWVELVAREWSLEPGREIFHCERMTLTQDVLIQGFRALSPSGTHHVAVYLSPPAPDGMLDCTQVRTGEKLLYVTGVGTDDFLLPAGAALPVPAGQQVVLDMHLVNATSTATTGRSGILVRPLDAQNPYEPAGIAFEGVFSPTIAPGETTTASVRCRPRADATLIDLWPHMHLIGKTMVVTHAGSTLLDAPYSFAEQRHHPMTRPLLEGDAIDFTCTWFNDRGITVKPGPATDDEMCMLGMFVVPAVGVDCSGL